MSDIIPTIKVMPWGEGQGDHVLINEADFDPERHELFGEAAKAASEGTGELSDEQLRAAIEAATGKAPHHKFGREKLLDQFNALNAAREARQGEVASNGLTRREIEADLEGMSVEFDPRDAIEDLAALRDLSREAR